MGKVGEMQQLAAGTLIMQGLAPCNMALPDLSFRSFIPFSGPPPAGGGYFRWEMDRVARAS